MTPEKDDFAKFLAEYVDGWRFTIIEHCVPYTAVQKKFYNKSNAMFHFCEKFRKVILFLMSQNFET